MQRAGTEVLPWSLGTAMLVVGVQMSGCDVRTAGPNAMLVGALDHDVRSSRDNA
jgi:hypothetical protein